MNMDKNESKRKTVDINIFARIGEILYEVIQT